jgi:hypothetical protein
LPPGLAGRIFARTSHLKLVLASLLHAGKSLPCGSFADLQHFSRFCCFFSTSDPETA